MNEPVTILFVCTGNSCRSQMAEGLARFLGGSAVDAYSAGTNPIGIVERTHTVMGEIGVDISGQASDPLETYVGQPFDYVITLCGHAEAMCPTWTGSGERLHWPVADPYSVQGTEAGIMAAYRSARDTIRDELIEFFSEIGIPIDEEKLTEVEGG
ncbi:MAG: arsenate reductase ArsC [Candidatus Coatesbacteria bacterium]|nr:MAG: arsenate reductase ArsC [Candidatus Coatesbacteria bacterium]